ncbi:ATP-binding protein, partial [Bacillus sp. JJ1127]|uniref:AAA family ATPase n=1 Tax=Bacillus sp. JJ1127 TaxID=3122952 RepID=UPI002FFD6100
MTNYKIRKLSIKNFKHVANFSIDFSEKDLIVFDGPNGFGKTTLFDALELVISGGISRVTNTADGRYGYNDLLFSNQNNKDTTIKIEFYNENENFTVVKRFNANKSIRPLDRKPDNWNLFETYLLKNFDSPLSESKPISTEELHSKLGMRSL